MTITLKGVPPSLNRYAGRGNTWDYRTAKARWTQSVTLLARTAKGRPKAPWAFAEVEITYFFPTRSRRDADNYCGKFLLDGLTKARVIVDDDFKHIRLTVRGECDKDNPRTVIRVREAER